jgi:hypothetical protein
MSPRARAVLLRCYPPAWRARYGPELEQVMLARLGEGAASWRIAADIVATGARERLRAWGLAGNDGSTEDQARSGVLLVLGSWALLTLGDAGVRKFSEHWEGLTPGSRRALPAGAFDALRVAGVLGTALLAAGMLLALPRLVALLRSGGWSALRRPALRAFALTSGLVLATAGLAGWAHGLNAAQRNGSDTAYVIAFLTWGALAALTLLAWTLLAGRCARLIEPSGVLLRREASLALAVALAALVATGSTALWWGALAALAPSVLHGRAAGGGSALVFPLALDAITMALGSLLALAGARRCTALLRTARG